MQKKQGLPTKAAIAPRKFLAARWRCRIEVPYSMFMIPNIRIIILDRKVRISSSGFGKMFGIRKIIQLLQSERPKLNTNFAIRNHQVGVRYAEWCRKVFLYT
jgi:hypothetical protein